MDLEGLAEMARNRGLKLLRSRVRSPGKPGFGKVGITDPSGAPVFGIQAGRPAADPDEAAQYLRELEQQDWTASLQEVATQRPKTRRSRDPEPQPTPEPVKPTPAPRVRVAKTADAAALVPLLSLLGYELDTKGVTKRLRAMTAAGQVPIVATLDDEVIGLCGVQVSTMIQRDQPVGRITVLVVAQHVRRHAIGRMLVEAAEERFRAAGCELVEVTSNDKHLDAHAFYRRVGYERTSIRFAKPL